MLDAYADYDWTAASEHVEALLAWLDRGGFPPQTVAARKLRPDINRAITFAACRLVQEKAASEGIA